ncbi:MAG: hypothetical protein E6344_07380 [Clostridium sp.]|nr:hypothetical protein [Clostridium sp.]
MACRNAVFNLDDWFICTITGESCKFINPDSVACVRRFKEGANSIKVKDRSSRMRCRNVSYSRGKNKRKS